MDRFSPVGEAGEKIALGSIILSGRGIYVKKPGVKKSVELLAYQKTREGGGGFTTS